jgi:hypothetical protein
LDIALIARSVKPIDRVPGVCLHFRFLDALSCSPIFSEIVWRLKSGKITHENSTYGLFHSPGYYASENRVDQAKIVFFLENHIGASIVAVQNDFFQLTRLAFYTRMLAKRSKTTEFEFF